MENKILKVKRVNAYVDAKGHKFVVVEFEGGEKTFINEGLLAYACQNAKTVKAKESK